MGINCDRKLKFLLIKTLRCIFLILVLDIKDDEPGITGGLLSGKREQVCMVLAFLIREYLCWVSSVRSVAIKHSFEENGFYT